MKIKIILLCLLFGAVNIFGQKHYLTEKSNDKFSLPASYFFLEISGGSGINLNRKFVEERLLSKYHSVIEIKFGKKTNGEKIWHKLYNNPDIGFGIHLSHLSRDNRVGNPFSVFSFINFPLHTQKYYSGSFLLQGGISFFKNNQGLRILPDNPLLGSKINAIIGLKYHSNFQIAPSLSLLVNLGLTHFSNGGIQSPNPGINLLNANIGTKINFQEKKSIPFSGKHKDFLVSPLPNQLLFNINIGTVTNYIKGIPGYRYLTHSSYIDWIKQYGKRGSFGIGTGFFYDGSTGENTNIRVTLPKSSKIFMGLHIGHEINIAKLSILSYFGFYYLKGSQSKGNIYSRLGLKYNFWRKTYGIIALKTTDGMSADFIEFGLGYAFTKKRR